MDNQSYVSDQSANNISRFLYCSVIKSRLDVTTVTKNMGSFASTSGYLSIEKVNIGPIVPKPKDFCTRLIFGS